MCALDYNIDCPSDFMCIAIVVSEACLVGLLGALFTKFRAVNGWTWAEIVFLYGLGNLAYSLMRIIANQLDDFDRYIIRGDLDTVLTKPVPPLFYILAKARVELHHAARLLTSVVIFILRSKPRAYTAGRWVWPLFTVLTVLSGTAIMFALMLISASVALWTTKSGIVDGLAHHREPKSRRPFPSPSIRSPCGCFLDCNPPPSLS